MQITTEEDDSNNNMRAERMIYDGTREFFFSLCLFGRMQFDFGKDSHWNEWTHV